MAPFREDPFWSKIVNVHWSSGAPVLVLWIEWSLNVATIDGSTPSINVEFQVSPGPGSDHPDVYADQVAVRRAGALGAPPAISGLITPEELAYYAMWSLPPYVSRSAISESTGGGYYYITTNFATFPDFVFSPYSSVAAADAYLAEQLSLHPEYAGGTGTINFFPPFDHKSQDGLFRSLLFINLQAYPKKTDGSLDIELHYILSGNGDPSGKFTLDGFLWVQGSGVEVTIDPSLALNTLGFSNIFDAFYNYHEGPGSYSHLSPGGTVDVSAMLNVTTVPPAITGPASPGGGGGG